MILGIIPARFASTRLMGKPLAEIGDKPMIIHTYESASKSQLINKLLIAVDDERVAKVCRSYGAETIMTSKDLQTGSDRIAEVTLQFPSAEIIINIQGDEPFIKGKMIDQAIEPLLFDKSVEISTLAKRITSNKEFNSPDVVKVVFDYQNFALYFSRSPIPFARDAKSNTERISMYPVYKHIGLYVYRRESLLNFTELKQTDLEQIEKLEQLRMLENGMKIKIVETEFESFSVDTQEDLEKARKLYTQYLKRKNSDENS